MKKYLLPAFLLAFLALAPMLHAQTNGDLDAVLNGPDDESGADAPERGPAPALVRADRARIVVNGQEWNLTEGQELLLTRETKYDVAITQLAPNSRIYVEFIKAGAVLNRQAFNANGRGEYLFAYTTPGSRGQGEARIKYTSSSGKAVTVQVKVKLQ